MLRYSELATATNILWKLIEANGHDPEVLYPDVGIEPDLLNKPGARIPYPLVDRVWAKAAEIIDDPCFGLKASNYWHPSYFHALGYAWLASHTLREARTVLSAIFEWYLKKSSLSWKKILTG